MTHYSDRVWDDAHAERSRVEREVASTGVNGYCVFGGHVGRSRVFNEEMRAAAGRPLLVASDLEQGLGQQMRGGTIFPSQMAIAAAEMGRAKSCGGTAAMAGPEPVSRRENDELHHVHDSLAGRVGKAIGAEAALVGVNVVFTPVADLATDPANPIIGVRSYGAAPGLSASMVEAAVAGLQSEGVAATAKHFPGHGDTSVDSHIDLPVLSVDRDTLERRELVPFRAAVDAGVRMIMTGHLAFPALTGDERPATLSPEVGEELLRGELGFRGVVITDAMLMGGVAKHYGPEEAAVMALLGGADVVLMPEDVERAIDGVHDAVISGRISLARVERSLGRIDDLLSWLESGCSARSESARAGAAARGDELPDEMAASHARLAAEAAGGAVTSVLDTPGRAAGVSDLVSGDAVLAALVDAERPPDLEVLRSWAGGLPGGRSLNIVSERTGREELSVLAARASTAGALALFVFDYPSAWKGRAGFGGELEGWARGAMDVAPRSAAVVFAGPRLLDSFATAGRLLCCYDGSPAMQTAAVRVLSGETRAAGVLPAGAA